MLTVDVLSALRSNDKDHPPFLKADFHWTAWGAAAAAKEVAATIKSLPGSDTLQVARFETKATSRQQIISTMRRFLQASCVSSCRLPKWTRLKPPKWQSKAGTSWTSSGATNKAVRWRWLGRAFPDLAPANFSGFLSQEMQTPVSNYAVSGGNQFGSITSYITSAAFLEKRPRFLIWENPIYNNLGKFGDAPLRELAAAAANICEDVSTSALSTQSENLIDLGRPPEALTSPSVILADAGSENSRRATLRVALKVGISSKPRFRGPPAPLPVVATTSRSMSTRRA